VSVVSGDFVVGICVQADTKSARPRAGKATRAEVLNLVLGEAGRWVMTIGRYLERRGFNVDSASAVWR
jgi:hypothetical protein